MGSTQEPLYIVLRHDFVREVWVEVDRVRAADAGSAFRKAVLPEPNVEPAGRWPTGEYLALPLGEDFAHIGVELTLTDLAAEAPLAEAGEGR